MTPAAISPRHLCTLTTPELFLLCSLRLSAQTAGSLRRVDAAYREGFERARLTPVHADRLLAAMRVIRMSARTFDVRHPQCPEVSADEETVLQTTRLLQEEDEFSARRLAWRLLPPSAARLVIEHLDALAIGMTRAGLMLPDFRESTQTCPAAALAARRLAETTGRGAGADAPEPLWIN